MAKAKSVCSWHDIPDTTIDAFMKAVQKLREEMIPVDCDGDSAVQVIIVDRRKYEPMHYEPLEYSHVLEKLTGDAAEEKRDWNDRMRLMNFKMASDDLERHLYKKINLRQLQRDRAKTPQK